ncbi:MAG: glycoside hydrolase family 27 protein [Bryocella sp.]
MWIAAILVAIVGSCIPVKAQETVVAQTPPMGWNSWNHFGCHLSDVIVRAQADAMVSNGMKAAGYTYINIDDCWQGKRDASGVLHANDKFPDMKGLADYVHSKGLKLGIYSSPGPKTCAGYEGSFGHEEQDAKTFAAWGMDFLKYDLCSLEGKGDQRAEYKKMGDALRKAGRPMVYSLCQYGMEGVWEWGPEVGATMWRTTDDIRDNFYIAMFMGFSQNGLEKFAGPGKWNDPDMLEVGNKTLSENESKSHMSLWAIIAAPLIAGNDLAHMSRATLGILTNPEVIAVDQDKAGIQGRRIWQQGPLEIWMKPLADGTKAVALFNLDWGEMPLTLRFSDIGMSGKHSVRDLWSHKDLGTFDKKFTVRIPKHGVAMLRVK